MKHSSPKLARKFLKLMSGYNQKHSIIDDFEETYQGSPISLTWLRCGSFDVDSYYLMNCCLAGAATSML